MADWVRLFGRVELHQRAGRRVESLRLRGGAAVPAGAAVRVADVQLQPGRFVTGWTLHARDLGVEPISGWSIRNGVVAGRRDVVIAADVSAASPTVWDVRGPVVGDAKVGRFLFGTVGAAGARVDGSECSATQGAGIPPHLTARADVTVPADVAGRALVCCWFRGLSTPADRGVLPPPPPAHATGPLTAAHPGWWQVLATHPDWGAVLAAHPDWS